MRKNAYRALSRQISNYLSLGGIDHLFAMNREDFTREYKRYFKEKYNGKYNSRYYKEKSTKIVESIFDRFIGNNETHYDIKRIDNASIKLATIKEDNPELIFTGVVQKRKIIGINNGPDLRLVAPPAPYWFYKDQLEDKTIMKSGKRIDIFIGKEFETTYENAAQALVNYIQFRNAFFPDLDSSVELSIEEGNDFYLFTFNT